MNESQSSPCLILREQNLLEMLPHDRKQNTLQPIRQNLRLQTPKHQSLNPALLNHILHHLRIAQTFRRTLLINLDHPDAIRARVGNGTGGESHYGASAQFAEGIILLWYFFGEEVVGEEPGVVAYEGGGGGGKGALVEGWDSFCLDFVDDVGEFAGDLHGGFDCIL